ncbi:MAG: Fis family transcriptional regulator [Acholeplasmataceae bacterium]|nr:Fis family transcriptional regulator [Acholeplasmataceae bacterium]
MKEIILTQNKTALVDDDDFDLLIQFRWWAVNEHNHFYASTEINGKQIKMHRFLLNPSIGQKVDHVDGNGLNNQRNNIRICNTSQNAMNSKKCADGRSKYKGVWIVNKGKKKRIRAALRLNGVLISLGSFKDELTAAKAYDKAALKYFGEFANLNFKRTA